MIKRQGHGARETFTVRKQSFGVGVERTFPLHSPKIERIEVAARGDVRRAKLYYLRDRVGKRARVRERRSAGPEVAVERELLHAAAFAEEEGAMPTPEQEAAVLAAAEAEAAGEPEATATSDRGRRNPRRQREMTLRLQRRQAARAEAPPRPGRRRPAEAEPAEAQPSDEPEASGDTDVGAAPANDE